MPEEVQQPAPQPQVTTTVPKSHDWKKVGLTILIILVVAGLIVAAYWFLILNKSSEDSDLTGPVPKVTTKTSTESEKEATESAEKDETADWKTFTGELTNITFKYPQTLFKSEAFAEGSFSSVRFSNYTFKADGGDSCEGKNDCFVLSEETLTTTTSKEYETVSGINVGDSTTEDNETGPITYSRRGNLLSDELVWLVYDVERGGKWTPKYSYSGHLKTQPYGFNKLSISSDSKSAVTSNEKLLKDLLPTVKFKK